MSFTDTLASSHYDSVNTHLKSQSLNCDVMCVFLFLLQVESADKEVKDDGQGDGQGDGGRGDEEEESGDVGQGGDGDKIEQSDEGEKQ